MNFKAPQTFPLFLLASLWVGLVCLMPSSPASPQELPERLRDYASRLQIREDDLKATIREEASACPFKDRILRQNAAYANTFCSEFSPTTALPEWKRYLKFLNSEKLPARHRMACTEALIEHCGFARNASYRAAFLLDYAYWNLELDRLSEEMTDALHVRDRHYEFAALQETLELLQSPPEALPDAHNPLYAPQLPLAKLIEGASQAMGISSVEGVTQTLDLRSRPASNRNVPLSVMFTDDIIRVLQTPDDIRVMREIYAYLKDLTGKGSLSESSRRQQLAEPHGGWKRFLQITHQDPRQVIRVLGTLASLRDWVRSTFPKGLASQKQLTPEVLDALLAGSASYYLLNTVDEVTADLEPNQKDLRYHFFYPPEYTTTDWKIYHWFSNAHLGCRMRERGFSETDAKVGTRLLAATYEALTLNLAGPSKKAMDVDPRISPILEGYRDIELNAEAGAWGAELRDCTQRVSR